MIRGLAVPAARAGRSRVAAGSFYLPPADESHADADDDSAADGAVSRRVAVEVGRLRFAATLPVLKQRHAQLSTSSLTPVLPLAGVADTHVTAVTPATSSAPPRPRFAGVLDADFRGGALQFSVPLARFGVRGDASGGFKPESTCASSSAAKVHVEIGARLPGGADAGASLGAVDPDVFQVVFEPHLARWARLETELDSGVLRGGRRCAGTSAGRLALPVAVAAEDELSEAVLALGATGPQAVGTMPSRRLVRRGGSIAWRVPVVSLRWILGELLPAVAPNATEVSLVVWRAGTVGSAWRVVSEGLVSSERSRLSRLTVEWDPSDALPCEGAVEQLAAEGFARRGPILCKAGRTTELAVKRRLETVVPGGSTASTPYLPKRRASSSRVATAVKLLSMAEEGAAFGGLSVHDPTVAVYHRFPVSRVSWPSSGRVAANDASESRVGAVAADDVRATLTRLALAPRARFAAQLPDRYAVRIVANSRRLWDALPVSAAFDEHSVAPGAKTLKSAPSRVADDVNSGVVRARQPRPLGSKRSVQAGAGADDPVDVKRADAEDFVVTLEPCFRRWSALVGKSSTKDLPPGWVDERHLVLPVTSFVFMQASSSQPRLAQLDSSGLTDEGALGGLDAGAGVASVALSWVVDTALGGAEVDELVLQDPLFDVSPWVGAALGTEDREAAWNRSVSTDRAASRRFRRVRVQSLGFRLDGTTADEADAERNAVSARSAGCAEAMRWAARLGFARVGGRCPHAADSKALSVDVELIFARLS
eukprot:TRINITY_DN18499_c0_g1_i2.p1 TRINITY_DN18499_c0_g1~~TRINITY_DN18499_c0_g1_i2.p1  ORF type:complete len:878 (+),score=140.64 TRINITY_DN18499_c0_g1_i2:336-2636(+)